MRKMNVTLSFNLDMLVGMEKKARMELMKKDIDVVMFKVAEAIDEAEREATKEANTRANELFSASAN